VKRSRRGEVGEVKDQLHHLLLRAFGALPRRVRRVLVRLGSPKYTVGAICIVRRADGRVLLVRHSYYRSWGTPGGLAKRHERPELAAVRETREEVGLAIELVGEPVVVVEPVPHRVDVVYLARPAEEGDADSARPSSPEIEQLDWFTLDDLPQLQVETVTALRALGRAGSLELPEELSG
jgi:8-oxo-dGTP pyrophosphatase MutT (NUDIX family)